MRKEIPFITTALAVALTLQACNPFEPQTDVLAAPVEPTSTLPQPLKGPVSTPTIILQEIPTQITPTIEVEPFVYFSQKIFRNEFTEDGSELSKVGCGLFVGAMVTRTDPKTYHHSFLDFFQSIGKYGPARITKNGTSMEDHIMVLKSLGYNPIKLSVEGSTMESVKEAIKELTAQGIPVWVNTWIYSRNHHAMAVGIAPDNSIIFNDSLRSEGSSIPDSKIHVTDEKGKIIWKVYAIYPPASK